MQATKLIIVLRGFIGCANAYVRACNVAGPSITFSAIYYLHHGMVYIFCYKFIKIKYLQYNWKIVLVIESYGSACYLLPLRNIFLDWTLNFQDLRILSLQTNLN